MHIKCYNWDKNAEKKLKWNDDFFGPSQIMEGQKSKRNCFVSFDLDDLTLFTNGTEPWHILSIKTCEVYSHTKDNKEPRNSIVLYV